MTSQSIPFSSTEDSCLVAASSKYVVPGVTNLDAML
jgi:hypothetical protein